MSLPEVLRPYFIGAMELPDAVFHELLSGYGTNDPFWDYRPYPERFTMREALAHVADWNEIFRERIVRTRTEDNPTLPDCDEGKLAVERDYAHADPVAVLARFCATRRTLIDTVNSLAPEDWARTAHREKIGEVTISDQIALIVAHDAYHMRQAFDYRDKFIAGG